MLSEKMDIMRHPDRKKYHDNDLFMAVADKLLDVSFVRLGVG